MKPDWNLLRAFHATAETGSLSAAARRLGLTQPTLSRQVQALETELGVPLFERPGRRLVLTEVGRELADHVAGMQAAAEGFALAASGQVQEIRGRVRISASDTIAALILPKALHRIRSAAPGLTIEVIAENALSDLHRMEADIALRHARPDREGLVGQKLQERGAGFYASEGWVARHGIPDSPADVPTDQLLGFADVETYVTHLNRRGFACAAEDLRLLSGSALVIREMVCAGLGVAPMLKDIAALTPGLVEVLPGHLDPVATWLVTHEALRNSPRIRLVKDVLAEAFADP
ncbi:LysR family transcriptional regulator [Pseudooceanicola sp. HF7]|uniref:LysR family transcriptional regulator n=1 Tax=Pseudooceanicola sp. HF7 TaxID=2721560 RepID=UPI001430D268|nr:LysR family transcriptional regulator [Pseudooceanicola sp. HF7]NIZ11634.1 LysR family transcriptional regulator [Pseudooceanicola sp. HF7]